MTISMSGKDADTLVFKAIKAGSLSDMCTSLLCPVSVMKRAMPLCVKPLLLLSGSAKAHNMPDGVDFIAKHGDDCMK